MHNSVPSDVAFVIIRKGRIVGLESYGVQIKINDFYLETSSLTCGNSNFTDYYHYEM